MMTGGFYTRKLRHASGTRFKKSITLTILGRGAVAHWAANHSAAAEADRTLLLSDSDAVGGRERRKESANWMQKMPVLRKIETSAIPR